MEMNGCDDVRAAIQRVLEEGLKSAYTLIESQKGLTAGTLATIPKRAGDSGLLPKSYYINDEAEQEINDFPSILILTEGINKSTPSHIEVNFHDPNELPTPADNERYSRVHSILLHGFIMGQETKKLAIARDRMELAIWRTLHSRWSVGDNCALLKDTYQMGYQDLIPSSAQGIITGVSCRFQVRVYESIVTPVLGRADTIATDVALFT